MVKNNFLQKDFFTVVIIVALLSITSCNAQANKKTKKEEATQKAKVTFIELGSVNCIPCRQMQPVMKAIENKYGNKVKVIFYDVWQPDQKQFAMKYKIKLIPTQVFLDAKGKEFFRHEGFFPETEIDKVLKNHGLE